MAHLSIRIDLTPSGRLGPGKILLMEKIAEHGSISAAGRAMGMSYRRAWELVSELNASFQEPLVVAQTGGRSGGGAALTPIGQAVVSRYREIEKVASKASESLLRAVQASAQKKA